MNKITLHAQGNQGVTIVPNTFIDQYMPSANGAYVKVYLYLLRCLNGNCPEVTISSIADCLDNTENDIIRALNYWEKLNLILISRNAQNDIISIQLASLEGQVGSNIDLGESNHIHTGIAASRSNPIIDNEAVTPLTAANTVTSNNIIDTELDEVAATIHTAIKPVRKSYTDDKVIELTSNEEIQYTMKIVEIYLNRPLKPMDIQLIIYLYEELHFSAELIMFLYEYCVSKGKKNPSYIETVALNWAEEGIDTEAKAREATISYNEHFNAVCKAFGLNRSPGQIERQYIKKWVEIFKFSDEIITEACNRALLHTQKPDFKYTNKILETWYKKGVKDKSDIIKLDEEFNSRKKTDTSKVAPISSTTNKFNQYPQRTYTADDYAELERKLTNKGL
ncbi:MAG: DnaD domain protein [Clostridiales bacterium]|nr:DnaD domain protein [Clostridiales bacterium]